MKRPVLAWLTVAGSVVALDLWCDRNTVPDDTLSATTRRIFRTDTPLGAAAFVAGWAALTRWFVPHIINGGKSSS